MPEFRGGGPSAIILELYDGGTPVQDEDRWYPYPNDPARKIGFIIASARAQRRNDVIRQRA